MSERTFFGRFQPIIGLNTLTSILIVPVNYAALFAIVWVVTKAIKIAWGE